MTEVLIWIAAIVAVVATIFFGIWLSHAQADKDATVQVLWEESIKTTIKVETLEKKQAELQAYINTMPHPKHRYGLNPEERDVIAGVIEAEAGGEDWTGKVLIAQCILNACEKDGIRPIQAVRVYQYATARPEPSDLSYAAVRYVFDEGQTVTEQPVLFFYAPKRCASVWHESQRYLFEHGGHRFFASREE